MQNFRPISEEVKNLVSIFESPLPPRRNAMRTRYICRSEKSTNGVVAGNSSTSLWAGCRNARLTARLGNRELTVTARLTCGRVARSTVSKP